MIRYIFNFSAFLLVFSLSSSNLFAVIKLEPIVANKIAKSNKTINTENSTPSNAEEENQEKYDFLFDLQFPVSKELSNNFILPRIKNHPGKKSLEIINKLNFIRGNFDELNINPAINLDQLWMMSFSKFNNLSYLDENNIPEDMDDREKLKYKFLLMVLKQNTTKAEFFYNIYAESFAGGDVDESFDKVAKFYLYDIAPDVKLGIKDLDYNNIAILYKKKQVNRLLEINENDWQGVDKEKRLAVSLLDGIDDVFAIRTMETSGSIDLLRNKYTEVGRGLYKKGVIVNKGSFEQLPSELKRALLFYGLFIELNKTKDPKSKNSEESDDDQLKILEFVSSFIKLCAVDKVLLGYEVIYPMISRYEPSGENIWLFQDIIKVFAFVGDKEKLVLWLNYLRERSPSDWLLVSAFDVFSYNKTFVDPLKVNAWLANLSSRIANEEIDPAKRELKLNLLRTMVDRLLLGNSVDGQDKNKDQQLPFHIKLAKLIARIDNNLEINNVQGLLDNIIELKVLGLGEYVPSLVMSILAYYDF